VDNTTVTNAVTHARRAAMVHAANAVAAGRVLRDDREDLAQDAMLGLVRELPKFDGTRASLPTFIERVISTRVASAIRRRRASKRVPAHEDWFATSCQDYGQAADLRVDVWRVIQSLPVGDRRVAAILTEHSPAEAARILGLARSTVYLSIERIRDAFVAAGIYRSCGPWLQRGEK